MHDLRSHAPTIYKLVRYDNGIQTEYQNPQSVPSCIMFLHDIDVMLQAPKSAEFYEAPQMGNDSTTNNLQQRLSERAPFWKLPCICQS
jgi:hypothetical protein